MGSCRCLPRPSGGGRGCCPGFVTGRWSCSVIAAPTWTRPLSLAMAWRAPSSRLLEPACVSARSCVGRRSDRRSLRFVSSGSPCGCSRRRCCLPTPRRTVFLGLGSLGVAFLGLGSLGVGSLVVGVLGQEALEWGPPGQGTQPVRRSRRWRARPRGFRRDSSRCFVVSARPRLVVMTRLRLVVVTWPRARSLRRIRVGFARLWPPHRMGLLHNMGFLHKTVHAPPGRTW